MAGFALAGGLSGAIVAETAPTTTGAPTDATATGTTAAPTTSTTPWLPEGVTVAGIPVGGLSPVAAYAAVRDAFAEPLVLLVGHRRLRVAPGRLGAVAYVRGAVARARDVAPGSTVGLVVVVRGADVRSYISSLARRFDRRPVDSRLFLRHLRPFITKDVPGRRLERGAAAQAIVGALLTGTRGPLRLPFKAIAPAVTHRSFGPVIVIHRDSRRLELYRGMRLWRHFIVATGQARYPTPLGRVSIVVRWRNPWWYPPASPWARGLRPIPPGFGNPLGTRWMGLSVPGVGIHGTPDAASLGYSVSHGCIRMSIREAEWLFEHVAIGTPVFIVAD